MSIIQKQIKELFASSEKTQEEFSKRIGVSRQTLGTYLRGQNIPDADTIRKICDEFNVSADWLLGLSDIRSTDKDFKAACNTFDLSERAGQNLCMIDKELKNFFLELPENELKLIDYPFNMFLISLYSITESSSKNVLDLDPNGRLTIDVGQAAMLFASMTGQCLSSVLNMEVKNKSGKS